MSQKKYSKRIAATAGSLACIAAAPAVSEAGLVTVTGSPVTLATSAASGTSVTWDIDGVGIGEFRLWKSGGDIQFASDTFSSGQGNGRSILYRQCAGVGREFQCWAIGSAVQLGIRHQWLLPSSPRDV